MPEDTWTSSIETQVLARELGERIRSYRSDAGVEIGDLSTRTRIGQRYLSALEAGKLEELPGPVFVKGFIRSICLDLRRDPEPLIGLVEEIVAEQPAEEVETGNGTRRTLPLVITGILLAGLITGGILIHGGDAERKDAGKSDVTRPERSITEGSADKAAPEEEVVDLDLVLRATEKTWLRIQADSSRQWETTMKPGDEIRLKAVDRVSLFIGNAGGILFELNGKRFGPLGSSGQVISNYVITRDNL